MIEDLGGPDSRPAIDSEEGEKRFSKRISRRKEIDKRDGELTSQVPTKQRGTNPSS